LGLSYQYSGEYNNAEKFYKVLIELEPAHIDGLNNLGIINLYNDKTDIAEKYFLQVLKLNPENEEASINLANLKLKQEEYNSAIEIYKKVISFNNSKPNYIFNLGNAYLKKGDYDEALKYFDYTLRLEPQHGGALNNLGIIYNKKNEHEKAEAVYKSILSNSPNDPGAIFNLAQCFEHNAKFDKAEETYNLLLELEPDNDAALLSLGGINEKLGRKSASDQFYNKIAPTDFNKLAIFTNLGVSKMEQGKIDEAIEMWEKALKLKPDSPEVNYNLAHAKLLKGNFEEGWKGYEWRKKRKGFTERKAPGSVLTDQDINGKTIFVYDEQGLGDSVQFVRYLKLLKEKNCKIIFECDPRLIYLFNNLKYCDELIPRYSFDEPKIKYDYQISLLSLPAYFKTNLNSIPAETSYLEADKELSSKLSAVINRENTFNVGIVWAGNPNHTNDKNRSCSLENFEKLIATKGARFFSLQKGKAVKQLEEKSLQVVNLDGKGLETFGHTAAVIENLDLVISVDTSVAHLAAAMGKKTWIILPFLPDWRWMVNRDDSPWYPEVKLYRQSLPGNWGDLFEKMEEDLLDEVKTKTDKVSMLPVQSEFNKEENNNVHLYLGLAKGDNFGWGVCSKYLRKELQNFINVENIKDDYSEAKKVNGMLFNALVDIDFNPLFNARGDINFGYTFFENELTQKSKLNAAKYDKIYAGSSWCRNKMIEAGIFNSDILIQGIDPDLFYPVENKKDRAFVIFSGGKFELRKGQDLVIKAVKILQEKYKDIVLVNSWYNFWENTMLSMGNSNHIKFELNGKTWEEKINNILLLNGLDLNRVITLPVIPHDKSREIFEQTDIGLFPNRCEGGTNLVLMEYMACGKPAAASFTSGHTDIINEDNSILLTDLNKFKLHNNHNELISDWEEASIDEIVAAIEYAYHNRDKIKTIGRNAGEYMKYYSWADTAKNLSESIELKL
jgi:tetratricopeptide (TPR) repeat protein